MPVPFELQSYIQAMLSRWRRIGAAVAIAAAVALIISLALPKKYDATVTVVIQPAAGVGAYPATMSAVYLEYLRSYEHFVQSDGLLGRLIQELKLNQPPYRYTVESLRNSVLKITLVRHTKILKVRARFPDAQKAHDIASKLASLATRANAEVNAAETARAAKQIEAELVEARRRAAQAQATLEAFRRETSSEVLGRSTVELLERRIALEGQLSEVRLTLAEKHAQVESVSGASLSGSETAGLRAKEKALREALKETAVAYDRAQARLASVELRRQELEQNLELAQRTVATFTTRANDTRAVVTARSEELLISDPGVVPTRPSAPRITLNVLAAAVLGFLMSILYETWRWNSQQERAMAALVNTSLGSGR